MHLLCRGYKLPSLSLRRKVQLMASETHLTYRWYQAMSILWAEDICLRRVIACPSSALQGNLSMLHR